MGNGSFCAGTFEADQLELALRTAEKKSGPGEIFAKSNYPSEINSRRVVIFDSARNVRPRRPPLRPCGLLNNGGVFLRRRQSN